MLELHGIRLNFGDKTILSDLHCQLQQGEIGCLLGHSGCGKTTALRAVAGFEQIAHGEIRINGRTVADGRGHTPAHRRGVGMVFQDYALFPHLSVTDNITFGLHGSGKAARQARADELLRLIGLEEHGRKYPHQLSGGQQQRVALARSLAKRPKLLLLDEPLGALDKKLRQQTQLELVNTLEEVGATCIMVTHDQEEAMTMATRIAIMSEGQLQQVGSPSEIYDYPNSRFTAEFIGETNIFSGKVIEDAPDHVIIECADLQNPVRLGHGITGSSEQSMWLSIRPEDVNLHKERPAHLGQYNWAQGVVKEIAYLGSFAIFYVTLPTGKTVKSQVLSSHWELNDIPPPTWDETVYISWQESQPAALNR